MIFKISKEELIDKIKKNAAYTVDRELNNNNSINNSIHIRINPYSSGSGINFTTEVDAYNLAGILQRAISSAVANGFQTMLENRYTDDDFEKDMTLKP